MKKLICLAALAVSLAATAAEIADVKFADTMKLGGTDLVLNGAGLRVKVFFKVYVAGLYLPEKKSSPGEVLSAKGPKRLHIVTKRDLTADQFADALVEGMQANLAEADLAAMKPRIDQFRAAILGIKEAKENTVVDLDWVPGAGTRFSVNGKPQGADIPGEDFNQAILRIWLGDKPAQADLKEALLGKSGG